MRSNIPITLGENLIIRLFADLHIIMIVIAQIIIIIQFTFITHFIIFPFKYLIYSVYFGPKYF